MFTLPPSVCSPCLIPPYDCWLPYPTPAVVLRLFLDLICSRSRLLFTPFVTCCCVFPAYLRFDSPFYLVLLPTPFPVVCCIVVNLPGDLLYLWTTFPDCDRCLPDCLFIPTYPLPVYLQFTPLVTDVYGFWYADTGCLTFPHTHTGPTTFTFTTLPALITFAFALPRHYDLPFVFRITVTVVAPRTCPRCSPVVMPDCVRYRTRCGYYGLRVPRFITGYPCSVDDLSPLRFPTYLPPDVCVSSTTTLIYPPLRTTAYTPGLPTHTARVAHDVVTQLTLLLHGSPPRCTVVHARCAAPRIWFLLDRDAT